MYRLECPPCCHVERSAVKRAVETSQSLSTNGLKEKIMENQRLVNAKFKGEICMLV